MAEKKTNLPKGVLVYAYSAAMPQAGPLAVAEQHQRKLTELEATPEKHEGARVLTRTRAELQLSRAQRCKEGGGALDAAIELLEQTTRRVHRGAPENRPRDVCPGAGRDAARGARRA